jgi:tetratricopeptide (TPR) repeat protein
MAKTTTETKTEHITVELLRQVVAGRVDPSELVRRGLAHIRELCPDCDARFAEGLPPLRDELAAPPPDFKRTFDAVSDTARDRFPDVEADLARAQKDLDRLVEIRDPDERLELIRTRHRRMRSPALVDLLLSEARAWLGHDPREALHLVEAAALVAQRIPEDKFGRERGHQLHIRAEAHRANVLRVLGELRAADSAWRGLRTRLQRHPVEAIDEIAELASLEASLRMDLREFDQAERLLGQAQRIYQDIGDTNSVAKIRVQQGKAAFLRAEPEVALQYYDAARELLQRANQPDLYLMSQHNRADCLVELGRPEEAARVIDEQRDLYAQCDEPELRSRLAWLEGRVARLRGKFAEAETRFLATRNGYLERGFAYDAALVSVDLAELYLAWAKPAEARLLAELMHPIFQSQRVHREAFAALLVFQQAARDELLTTAYLGALRRYLLVGRNDGEYRFEGSAALLQRATGRGTALPRRS